MPTDKHQHPSESFSPLNGVDILATKGEDANEQSSSGRLSRPLWPRLLGLWCGVRLGMPVAEGWLRRVLANHAWFRRLHGRTNVLGGSKQDEVIVGGVATVWHLLTVALAAPYHLLGSRSAAAEEGVSLGSWAEILYEVSEIWDMARGNGVWKTAPRTYAVIAGMHHMCAPSFVYAASALPQYNPDWWLPLAASGTTMMLTSTVQYVWDIRRRSGRRRMLALYVANALSFLYMRHVANRRLLAETWSTESTARKAALYWLGGWMNGFNLLGGVFALLKIRRVLRLGV